MARSTSTFLKLMTFILAVIVLAALVATYLWHYTPDGYGVVVNVERNSSTVKVYRWPGVKYNGTGVANLQWESQCEGQGLEDFVADPDSIKQLLKSCLDEAQKQIPPYCYTETRVLVGVSEDIWQMNKELNNARYREPTKQPSKDRVDEVLKSMTRLLITYPFNISQSDERVRIIDETEKNAYRWTAVNFVNSKFDETKIKMAGNYSKITILPEMYGVVNLDQSSVSISFLPSANSHVSANSMKRIRVFGVDYDVYSSSYKCYGMEHAHNRLLAQLVMNSNGKIPIDNPCAPKGHRSWALYEDLFEGPCSVKLPASLAANLQALKKTKFHFRGSNLDAVCKAAVMDLLNFDTNCSNCALDGVIQPPVRGKFMVFTDDQSLIEFTKQVGPEHLLQDFENTTQTMCDKTSKQLKLINGEAYVGCFNAHYIYTLFVEGLKLPPHSWQSIQFVQENTLNVYGKAVNVDWNLGFMINETNNIPRKYAIPIRKCPMIAVLLTGVGLVILWMIIYVVYRTLREACRDPTTCTGEGSPYSRRWPCCSTQNATSEEQEPILRPGANTPTYTGDRPSMGGGEHHVEGGQDELDVPTHDSRQCAVDLQQVVDSLPQGDARRSPFEEILNPQTETIITLSEENAQTPDKSPEKRSEASAGTSSKSSPDKISDETTGKTSEKSPDKMSEASIGRTSENSPDKMSTTSTGKSSDNSSSEKFEDSVGYSSENSPDKSPGQSPEKMSEESEVNTPKQSPGKSAESSPKDEHFQDPMD